LENEQLVKTYTVRTIDELKNAVIGSKKQSVSTLIDIKVFLKLYFINITLGEDWSGRSIKQRNDTKIV